MLSSLFNLFLLIQVLLHFIGVDGKYELLIPKNRKLNKIQTNKNGKHVADKMLIIKTKGKRYDKTKKYKSGSRKILGNKTKKNKGQDYFYGLDTPKPDDNTNWDWDSTERGVNYYDWAFTDEPAATSSSTTTSTDSHNEEKLQSLVSEECDCGRTVKRKEISGGEYANPKENPWVVRLVNGCPRGMCGGSLVSPRIVITAQHCTVDASKDTALVKNQKACDHSDEKRLAILGETNIDVNNLDSYYTIPVVEVRTPPNAWLEVGDYDTHDFAMLILKKAVKYSDYVRPICLPHRYTEYGGKWAKAAGWGRTDRPSVNREQSPRLKTVWLEVSHHKFKHHYLFGTKLSKKDNVYQDPCVGDSGGPLMWLNETVSRYTLIGTVFGSGYDCTTGDFNTFEDKRDGMWNKVSAHIDWVEENMKMLGEQICKT